MQNLVLNLIFFGLIYTALIVFFFWKESKRRNRESEDGDDEGGLPVATPPRIDLPPGVCLPVDGPLRVKQEEPEEVFA